MLDNSGKAPHTPSELCGHGVAVQEEHDENKLTPHSPDQLAEDEEDPPVVARMVVEIRSDGLRTIARGALEDVASGQKVAIHARGTTPMALAASLTKSMLSLPALATRAVGTRLLGRWARKR